MSRSLHRFYCASNVSIVIWLAASVMCRAQSCATIAEGSKQVARDYLLQRSPGATDECIAAALARIGEHADPLDSQVLVRYLDFAWITRQGIISVNKDNVNDLFPAVKGLVNIGRDAVPALLDRLKGGGETYSTRRNATRTIRLIYRTDSAAAMECIFTAASKEKGPAQSSLLEAAAWISTWCAGDEKASCEKTYQSYKEKSLSKAE
jgi:hypothetical protein